MKHNFYRTTFATQKLLFSCCVSVIVGCGGGGSPSTSTVESPTIPTVTLHLNDTGITSEQCYAAGSNTLEKCLSTAAQELNGSQDGMVGLDVNSDPSDGKGGFSFSLVKKGDGIANYDKTECVKDNVTGLIWEGKTSTGLRAGINAYTNYNDARAGDASSYVNAINQMKLCGFTDWRLPAVDELHSLVDYSVSPSLSNLKFQLDEEWLPTNISITSTNVDNPGSIYWTGTQDTLYHNWWAKVDFAYAYDKISAGGSASFFHVRLVRGEKAKAGQRYIYSSDGAEVTDIVTELTWRRCSEGQAWSGSSCVGTATAFTHEAALTYAQTVIDWRLPNAKELATLVDLTKAKPRINTTAFPAIPSCDAPLYCAFWSSTPNVSAPRGVFSVFFGGGGLADVAAAGGACQRRLNIDPLCRSNIDPGRVADFCISNCG